MPCIHPSIEGVPRVSPPPQLGDQAQKEEAERTHRSNEPTTRTGKRPAQRRLDRLQWLCFDDRCNRLDALSCSSTLVSFFTRVQVSCADISPSCSHLMLDNSAGDIKAREDMDDQLKKRDIDVAVATKRCHLRQSKVGLPGYNALKEGNKKAPAAWAEAR